MKSRIIEVSPNNNENNDLIMKIIMIIIISLFVREKDALTSR